MPRPLRAADLVVGMLTENTSRNLTQAIRLLRSLRWFGGELAGARAVVCGVGTLESSACATLEALGGEVRTVSRFHPANPTANKLQLLAELLEAPEEILFLLDCDTLIVRDPLPYLRADAFQAKIESTPTVSDQVFERLFRHFKIPKPSRSRVAPLTGTQMIPYFNAGVVALPKSLARTLAPVWRRYNQTLADHPELVAPCQRHMHQASLALALAETGLPCADLPVEMNFQINATHVTPPAGFATTDPVIIHYHHLATEDGFLLPTPYPAAQARIEMFHQRMRAEGFAPEQMPAENRESRPVVVAGMHRSGTSAVAHVLSALGVYAGTPDELMPADMFNPTGYWEHKEVVALVEEILDALGAGWLEASSADVSRLTGDQRAAYLAHARSIVARSLEGHGPFLLKDPRISLLFPLWREALQNPICIVTWRNPMAVARSLATRDDWPPLVSIALWEHYTRTLLRDTEGHARVLISYEELIADPARITRSLHAALAGFGMDGLIVPSAERIRQVVNPDFDRSGRGASSDETLLDEGQRALLADLKNGAALRGPVAPTSARTLELLAEFADLDALRKRVIERDHLLDDRDHLLGVTFASASWRIGHRITGLLRLLRRGRALSAEDRWREMKRRPSSTLSS